jgi:hypothetical protein
MSDSVMVPREPTEAMLNAVVAGTDWMPRRHRSDVAKQVWSLMIAASTPAGGWEDISSLARQMMAGKGAMGAVVDGLPEDVCELHADNLNALLDAIDVKSLHAILPQTEKGS